LCQTLFWIELANVLYQATRQEKITVKQATWAMWAMEDLGIPMVPSFDLLPHVMSLAVSHRRTMCHGVHFALAVQSGSEMIGK